jgi:hypothetical protein
LLAQAGSAGPTGATGSAATVNLGTVTTGAPGSLAAVSNSGTNSAAVLNFTIPQGATGAPGSGGSGGGTSGIPFASTYHLVSYSYPYYSVNGPNSSINELAPSSVLTWVPTACTATTLNVFSQQGNPITVTLRSGTPGNMANTLLSCTASANSACTGTGNVQVTAGSFVDFTITGPNSTGAAVWTALACN